MDDAPEHESPRRARFLRPQHRPERVADFFLCEVRARERDDDVFLFDEVRPQRRPVRVKARRELLRRRPRVWLLIVLERRRRVFVASSAI